MAVRWQKMVAVIVPHYPKGERGRRPFPLETMLRIHFMQQWFGLSDPGMEDELCDNVSLGYLQACRQVSRRMRRPSASFGIC